MFATFLRQQLAVRDGFLHVLWAGPETSLKKGQFAVMFAPSDAEGFMKPRYCRGVELSQFLSSLGLSTEGIERVLRTIEQERSASERVSLPQDVIQMFEPLADRVEEIVLKIVATSRLGSLSGHQDYWGGWMRAVTASLPKCADADLLFALKRLNKRGIVRLTRPGDHRYEGDPYSGSEVDDSGFFFTGRFNVVLTDEGRKYRDRNHLGAN